MPRGEAFDVGEEDGSVVQVESSAASAEFCVRVASASHVVVWASAAPNSEVCTVYACGLDEVCGGQDLTRHEAEGCPSEQDLHDPEPFISDAFLHMREVGFVEALSWYPQACLR